MINNFKNFLLKENSNKEVNFVKFNDNVYKLSINGDVIGSTYLQDAKKFTMFKSIIDLLPDELKDKKVLGIGELGLMNKYQGQGYGKILMDNIIRIAKSQNYDVLVLSVSSENERAINLYKSFNFEIFRDGFVKYMFLDLKGV
jgi:ribosomal protein S18 acetylase RimI-like enzyme